MTSKVVRSSRGVEYNLLTLARNLPISTIPMCIPTHLLSSSIHSVVRSSGEGGWLLPFAVHRDINTPARITPTSWIAGYSPILHRHSSLITNKTPPYIPSKKQTCSPPSALASYSLFKTSLPSSLTPKFFFGTLTTVIYRSNSSLILISSLLSYIHTVSPFSTNKLSPPTLGTIASPIIRLGCRKVHLSAEINYPFTSSGWFSI